MVSSVRADVGQEAAAQLAAQRQRETKRWSLFFSVFGAFAASAVLWAGIFWLVGWVGDVSARLFGG
jgi:hypothetical protein